MAEPRARDLRGRPTSRSIEEEGWRKILSEGNVIYESKEFVVPIGATDFDVKITATMFRPAFVPRAHHVRLVADRDISIKFNDATNDSIKIPELGLGGSPFIFELDDLEVENIFITVPGAQAVNVALRIF